MNDSTTEMNVSTMATTTPIAQVSPTTPYPSLIKLFGNAGFSPLLAIGMLPMWTIATCGVLFNAALVYVTLKKRLFNYCNVLIALDCFYCAVSELGATVTFLVVLSGHNWIPLAVCYPLLVVPNAGYVLSYGAMLAIAVERLCATLMLWRDGTTEKKVYVGLIIAANVCVGAYYVISGFVNFMANPSNLVTCNTGDLFMPGAYLTFLNISLGTIIATAACYCVIGMILRHSEKGTHKEALHYTRKVYRSLFAIMCVVVFGHFASAIWRYTKQPGGVIPALSSFYQEKLFYCLTYFANTANAPILYMMSSEYNRAFKSLDWNVFAFLDSLQIGPFMPKEATTEKPKTVVRRGPLQGAPKS